MDGQHRMLFGEPGVIGDGGNSGFQAINLAAQMGASQIVLVGFDMRIDAGLHWHGRHLHGLNNPREANVLRWRRRLDDAAGSLAERGIDVVNASQVSMLKGYRMADLGEVLAC